MNGNICKNYKEVIVMSRKELQKLEREDQE